MSATGRPPLRILQVETFGRGGLIHYAYNLSCALANRGHDVTLLTAASYELGGREVPAGVRVVPTLARLGHRADRTWPAPAASLVRKAEALADTLAVASFARRLRPDVVHLHCTNPIALAHVALLRRLRAPLVTTAHVVTPHERIPLQEGIYRGIHRGSDLVVTHSEFDRGRLLGEFAVDPGRVVVIPHGEYGFFDSGVDLPERDEARRGLGLEAGDEVALFFGYIREYKGLDVLLEAWPGVVKARPGARLLLAGDPVRLDPSRREQLQAWATRLGAVHRFGYVPFSEVGRYFRAADVLVMPYRHISQSGVLYLALSLGVPVVASRVGGLAEVLKDGESGLLVPPESPAELAEALRRVLGDPDLRERLARGGRRVAEDHSWPSIAGRTEAAFLRLLDGTPQSEG